MSSTHSGSPWRTGKQVNANGARSIAVARVGISAPAMRASRSMAKTPGPTFLGGGTKSRSGFGRIARSSRSSRGGV